MAANDRLQRWRQELQDLQLQRSHLEQAWEASLAELRATGQPPALQLLDDQEDFRRLLAALADDIALDSPQTAAQSPPALDALTTACDELQVAQQARAVLELLLQWEHVSEPEFEPLRAIQAQVVRALSELARTPLSDEQRATVDALARGEHPWCDLCRLQQSGSDVDDQAWIALHDRVVERFGRPLATAFSRGRIRSVNFTSAAPLESVADENAPPTAVEVAPLAAPPVPPPLPTQEIAESNSDSGRLPELKPEAQGLVYDFASAGTRQTGVLDAGLKPAVTPPEATPTGVPLLDPAHVVASEYMKPAAQPGGVNPDSGVLEAWTWLREQQSLNGNGQSTHATPAAALADAALAAAGEERVRCMFRLVDQLLIDDRLDVAYHLMRVLEGQPGERLTVLPATLIRAALFSRQVCYPQGELNRRVEDDLKKQNPRRHQAFAHDDRLAHEFLCRAAALPPALMCASTSAVRLLQAFPIEPGLIPLYNYCSRIASYAEKLQGKTAEMLQAGESATVTTHELATLQASARTWLAQSLKRTLAYHRSSPLFLHAHWTVMSGTVQRSPDTAQLWSQWHETWLTVHRLLRPVIHGAGGDRNAVKLELARLSPLLRQELSPQGRATSPEIQSAAAAMRGVLLQAVEFANGWLRLGGGKGASVATLPIQALDELRIEIRERTAAVLAALQPYAAIQKTPTLRAATFCLLRVVQQISELFESRVSLAWREPEPKHVLNAELLKIPCLPLNDAWEPGVPGDELEAELLEQLSRGSKSWREAFELHSRQGNHVTTGRLLELPVWKSPAETTELTQLRQERISESRREAQADFDTLHAEFRALCEQQAFAPSDLDVLRRRFDRLQAALGKTLDFQITEIQLQQLRLMMRRRGSLGRNGDEAAPVLITAAVEPNEPSEQFTDSLEPEVVEPAPVLEPESRNSWVMDILWEEQ